MILSTPLINKHFPITSRKAHYHTLLSGSINNNNLLIAYNGSNLLLALVKSRAPLDLCRLSLYDERVLHCVSLLIRDGQQLILGTGDQKTLGMPVTVSDFLSVLRDAWNLPLAFSVVKDKRTFLRANAKDWVSIGPTDV